MCVGLYLLRLKPSCLKRGSGLLEKPQCLVRNARTGRQFAVQPVHTKADRLHMECVDGTCQRVALGDRVGETCRVRLRFEKAS